MDKGAVHLIPGQDYQIRCANTEDLTEIKKLLRVNDLPTNRIDMSVRNFLVAVDHGGVIGVIGAHYDGTKALLRSFVVSSNQRRFGIGLALVEHMAKEMKNQGIEEVYLLTETAAEYFKWIGFYKIGRDEMPQVLLEESGLDHACPCSSQCMKFFLNATEGGVFVERKN